MTEIHKIEVGSLQTNCYVVSSNGVAFVVDIGAEPLKVKEYCDKMSLSVEGILLTHGHYDHVGAVNSFQKLTGAKIYVSEKDGILANSYKNMAFAFGKVMDKFTPDCIVEDGDIITIGDMTVKVVATAGHTAGGLCFILEDNIFSGDTLFQTSYGRTDFPTGDFDALKDSISKLFALEGDYKVFPGHGNSTTLSKEREHNLINFND